MKIIVNKLLVISFIVVFFGSCSPVITKQIIKSYEPTQKDSVIVYNAGEKIQKTYETLGTIKVQNTDFSKLSSYKKVIDYAKNEASDVGGNAIKLIEHIKPHTEMGFGFVFTTTHDIVLKF